MFTNPFLGYAGDKAMSEKKLLRDVFKSGDVYFNTGDLMLQDHRDFVYFKDRIGDTFRSLFHVNVLVLWGIKAFDCIERRSELPKS